MSVCVYCGRRLPLLHRVLGTNRFCSKEHAQAYQDEMRQLALEALAPAPRATRPPGALDRAALPLPSLSPEPELEPVPAVPEAPEAEPALFEQLLEEPIAVDGQPPQPVAGPPCWAAPDVAPATPRLLAGLMPDVSEPPLPPLPLVERLAVLPAGQPVAPPALPLPGIRGPLACDWGGAVETPGVPRLAQALTPCRMARRVTQVALPEPLARPYTHLSPPPAALAGEAAQFHTELPSVPPILRPAEPLARADGLLEIKTPAAASSAATDELLAKALQTETWPAALPVLPRRARLGRAVTLTAVVVTQPARAGRRLEWKDSVQLDGLARVAGEVGLESEAGYSCETPPAAHAALPVAASRRAKDALPRPEPRLGLAIQRLYVPRATLAPLRPGYAFGPLPGQNEHAIRGAAADAADPGTHTLAAG